MMSRGVDDVEFEGLTARARIRAAALKKFAEVGYERSTIRRIAECAGVSPGLVRHHFGSKADLRAACDGYVAEALHRLNSQLIDDPAAAAQMQRSSRQFGQYVARSLVEGSQTIGAIFDEMVTMTEQWIARADEHREDPPAVDRRIRAALVTAMAVGIPLLHEHVARALGADMFSLEGDRLVGIALLDIYSHQLIDSGVASAAAPGFQGGK